MALPRIFRARLALRIYLVGLAQIAVVAAGFFVLLRATRPTGKGVAEREASFVVESLLPVLGDPQAARAVMKRARATLGAEVAIEDLHGKRVLESVAGAKSCPDAHVPTPVDGAVARRVCLVTAVRLADGQPARISVTVNGPPSVATRVVPFVLLVVGISSWLLARTLTRPLERLSSSARRFGAGDLSTRANLEQRDELGDVGHAFDEMAERMTSLLRAEKELLANVSHELRTPLARVRVALDLASEGDASVAREALSDISGDLDELERLIADVLTTARLDLNDPARHPGIPPLRREQVDPRELLLHAAARFRSRHPERTLDVQLPSELPELAADPALLRRVVDNLLENAHKYSPEPATPIALRARARECVEIDIEDRGVGIAPADLARVFQPFFRADPSRARATGGLGLGLTLARRIVDAHGGTLALTSVPNEGTRASVRLPLRPELSCRA